MAKPGYDTDKSPKILEGSDLKALAKYMKSDSCRNVFIMVSWIPPVFSFHADAMRELCSLGLVRLLACARLQYSHACDQE